MVEGRMDRNSRFSVSLGFRILLKMVVSSSFSIGNSRYVVRKVRFCRCRFSILVFMVVGFSLVL